MPETHQLQRQGAYKAALAVSAACIGGTAAVVRHLLALLQKPPLDTAFVTARGPLLQALISRALALDDAALITALLALPRPPLLRVTSPGHGDHHAAIAAINAPGGPRLSFLAAILQHGVQVKDVGMCICDVRRRYACLPALPLLLQYSPDHQQPSPVPAAQTMSRAQRIAAGQAVAVACGATLTDYLAVVELDLDHSNALPLADQAIRADGSALLQVIMSWYTVNELGWTWKEQLYDAIHTSRPRFVAVLLAHRHRAIPASADTGIDSPLGNAVRTASWWMRAYPSKSGVELGRDMVRVLRRAGALVSPEILGYLAGDAKVDLLLQELLAPVGPLASAEKL